MFERHTVLCNKVIVGDTMLKQMLQMHQYVCALYSRYRLAYM